MVQNTAKKIYNLQIHCNNLNFFPKNKINLNKYLKQPKLSVAIECKYLNNEKNNYKSLFKCLF